MSAINSQFTTLQSYAPKTPKTHHTPPLSHPDSTYLIISKINPLKPHPPFPPTTINPSP